MNKAYLNETMNRNVIKFTVEHSQLERKLVCAVALAKGPADPILRRLLANTDKG